MREGVVRELLKDLGRAGEMVRALSRGVSMFKATFEMRFVRATVIVGVLVGVAGGILLARDVPRSCMLRSKQP